MLDILTHPCKVCIRRPLCITVGSRGCVDCNKFLEISEKIIGVISLIGSIILSYLFWFLIINYTHVIIISVLLTIWAFAGFILGIFTSSGVDFDTVWGTYTFLIITCVIGPVVALFTVIHTELENKIMYPTCLENKNK